MVSGSPWKIALKRLLGAARIVATRGEEQSLGGELQADLRAALGDEGNTLDRLDERSDLDRGHCGVLLRQQLAELRELGVQQAGGGAAAVVDDAEQPVDADRGTRTERQLDRRSWSSAKRFRGLGERLCGDQDGRGGVGVRRRPLELADREPEPVGGGEHDALPSISTRMPVSIGRVSSLPAATATWLMASENTSSGESSRSAAAAPEAGGSPRPAWWAARTWRCRR